MLPDITSVINELSRTLTSVAFEQQEKLADEILNANRVFVAGAGRSGMMARCFAMRLMHMGLNAYMVGEVVTPSIAAGDLLGSPFTPRRPLGRCRMPWWRFMRLRQNPLLTPAFSLFSPWEAYLSSHC